MYSKRGPLILGAALLTAIFLSGPSPAVAGAQFYGRTDVFTWAEYNQDGSRILEETGPMLALGVNRQWKHGQGAYSLWNVELFGGRIDYDGSTWSGSPVATKTNYLGLKAESTLHTAFSAGGGTGFFGGLGYRGWRRDLDSNDTANGYMEQWQTLYAKLGVEHAAGNVSSQLGVKLPLYNENRVDAFAVTLTPGKAPALFGEVKVVNRHSEMSLTYEGMRFPRSRSSYSSVYNQNLLQPDSNGDMWGIRYAQKF